MDHTSYYRRLQELAVYAERGDYQSLNDALNDKEILRYKNLRMIPLYQEAVAIIKHINNTEQRKIIQDYYRDAFALKKNSKLTEAEKQHNEQLLKAHYDALLNAVDAEYQEPTKKIDHIHQQLLYLYNLFRVWDQ